MPDWSKLEKEMKKREPVRKAFGSVKSKAVPVFEDCVNYPKDDVVALVRLARKIEETEFGEDTHKLIAEFAELLKKIQPVEGNRHRIYLWNEDNMPVLTDYTDNIDYRYNHNPDFKPYLLEMLIPEENVPKGAVIFCAGGDHADAVVSEAYQSALDFNNLGYQCFILLNRTNHNPWTTQEAGVDAARAVRIVRRDAEKYRIRPDQVAYAGFSNGGLTGEGMIEYFSGSQTVKSVFPDYVPDEMDNVDATPDAFLCIYGPRFVNEPFDYKNAVYPPTFFAVGREDFGMDNLNYVYPDLLNHGVPVEIHTFAGVPHGKAGIRLIDGRINYPNFELWIPLADYFMQNIYSNRQG